MSKTHEITALVKDVDIPTVERVISIDFENNSIKSIPLECICNQDQGAGYTYNDEYGDCPFCLNTPRKHDLRQCDINYPH